MNNAIYFPSFEPPSTNWLKFSLLYMENFRPIIPDRGLDRISPQYQDVIRNTDLITPYNPRYLQGENASLKAIEFVDKLKGERYRYSSLMNRPNLIRDFTDNRQKNFFIYGEKFSGHWEHYCRENNFAQKVDGGIMVAEELAFIYMTFLAEQIAFDEGMSIITDNVRFDGFLNYNRIIPRATNFRQEFAQSIMSLAIPRNISEIPISSLIDFRNKNRELIRSFNLELDNSLISVQNAITARDFIERFNNIYSELTKEVLAQGVGIITIPIGAYLLINNALATSPEYIKEILGGIGMLLTGRMAMSAKWKEISNMHNCRRYITNLERLS